MLRHSVKRGIICFSKLGPHNHRSFSILLRNQQTKQPSQPLSGCTISAITARVRPASPQNLWQTERSDPSGVLFHRELHSVRADGAAVQGIASYCRQVRIVFLCAVILEYQTFKIFVIAVFLESPVIDRWESSMTCVSSVCLCVVILEYKTFKIHFCICNCCLSGIASYCRRQVVGIIDDLCVLPLPLCSGVRVE